MTSKPDAPRPNVLSPAPSDREAAGLAGVFDAAWYLETYPDVRDSGVGPLDHYLRHGAAEGRLPHPAARLLDPVWYAHAHPGVRTSGLDPLSHFCKHGLAQGLPPNALAAAFDAAWYEATYPDVGRDAGSGFRHYLRFGAHEGRVPNAAASAFDADFYRDLYPDVRESGADPLLHYFTHGRAEGRRPNEETLDTAILTVPAWFDADWYADSNPDLLTRHIEPFRHYAKFGHAEGRPPNPRLASLTGVPVRPLLQADGKVVNRHADLLRRAEIFDRDWYVQRYAVDQADAERHYVECGAFLGYDPSPFFSSLDYFRANADVAALGENPLVHYVLHGFREGRPMAPHAGPGMRVTTRIWRKGT